jgi:hypothetical protein
MYSPLEKNWGQFAIIKMPQKKKIIKVICGEKSAANIHVQDIYIYI